MGFVAKIISKTKTRKLREANNNIARNCGHKIGVQNYVSLQHRRLPCVFDMKMIKRDNTNKELHTKFKIADLGVSKEMEEFLGDDKVVSLYRLEGNVLSDKCFTKARNMFNSCELDFSKIMTDHNQGTKKEKTTKKKGKKKKKIEEKVVTKPVRKKMKLAQRVEIVNEEEDSTTLKGFDLDEKTEAKGDDDTNFDKKFDIDSLVFPPKTFFSPDLSLMTTPSPFHERNTNVREVEPTRKRKIDIKKNTEIETKSSDLESSEIAVENSNAQDYNKVNIKVIEEFNKELKKRKEENEKNAVEKVIGNVRIIGIYINYNYM